MKHWLILLIIFLPLAAVDADEYQSEQVLAGDALALAEDIGRWLAANAIEQPIGIAWPDDALNPEVVGYDLASGVAGKVLYFVALYRATDNQLYLELAMAGADYLAGRLQDTETLETNSRKASLYSGIAGIGVALLQVQQHAAESRYSDAIEKVMSLLDEWSVHDSEGVRWSDEFNDLIYGDAGTVLFLSWYADQTGDRNARDLAQKGAGFLLAQAKKAPGGSFWYFRRSKQFNLPNFSHGTAGVSYVLATVAAQTGDEHIRRGAQAGFNYIKSIAEIEGGLLRIPYGWGSDSWEGLYEFGWAHGLAGTNSLFVRLQQTGIDADSAAEYERLSRHTLENINLPEEPASPFAEASTPLDLRFGRAGVLALDNAAHARLRNRIWAHIEEAATREGQTAHWQVDAPEFMGGGRAAYTGMFHGAAGIGLAILRMHAQITGRQPYVDLPDYPAK